MLWELKKNVSMICLLVWFDSLRPINNLSVKQGLVFLGWTSFAQGPQLSDSHKARTRGPLVSSQALYHWATQSLRLDETALFSTQNLCYNWWIRKYSQFYAQKCCLARAMICQSLMLFFLSVSSKNYLCRDTKHRKTINSYSQRQYMREQKLKTITDNLASVNALQYMHLKSTSILFIYVCQFSTITKDWLKQNTPNSTVLKMAKWASTHDFGNYHIDEQQGLRRDWAYGQSRLSLRFSHIQSMDVGEGSDQNLDP